MYIVSYLAFSVPALAAGLAVQRFGLESTAVAYAAVDVALILVAVVAAIVRARRHVGENGLRGRADIDERGESIPGSAMGATGQSVGDEGELPCRTH
jgi:hypothetical protein